MFWFAIGSIVFGITVLAAVAIAWPYAEARRDAWVALANRDRKARS